MSQNRLIADLIDSGGDVKLTHLDNVPEADWNTLTGKPTLAASATTDTTDASNISSGSLSMTRIKQGGSHTNYLRGDNTFVTNCTNHANCTTNGKSNCANCDGTAKTASGSVGFSGYLIMTGQNISLQGRNCNCNCACACNC